jgi:hypothetical protein
LFAVVACLVLPLCLFSLVEFCRFGRDAGDASGFFSYAVRRAMPGTVRTLGLYVEDEDVNSS